MLLVFKLFAMRTSQCLFYYTICDRQVVTDKWSLFPFTNTCICVLIVTLGEYRDLSNLLHKMTLQSMFSFLK